MYPVVAAGVANRPPFSSNECVGSAYPLRHSPSAHRRPLEVVPPAHLSKIKFSVGSLFIKSIHLKGIRAHQDSTVHFDDGINLIVGPNGAGKTNILEAVHLLCLSKSFLTSNDRYVLRRGEPFYEVEGHFESDIRGSVTVRAAFVPGEGKKIFVGGAVLERMVDLVGRFPIVVFSPGDQRLTAEGPEFRRRFLDNIVSQSSSLYLDHLLRYKKALKQRNELLLSARKRRQAPDSVLLDSWTQELVLHGAAIIADRIRFTEKYAGHLERAFEQISSVAERPTIVYTPFADHLATPENVSDLYQAELERRRQSELDRGVTLVGPHRDDLEMYLDEMPVRRFASQGQHRTFGMALKLAQYDYLKERSAERPILLLDDVFDNLDPARIGVFLDILDSDVIGQSITTAARKEIVYNHLGSHPCRTTFVAAGGLVLEKEPEDVLIGTRDSAGTH